MVIGFFFNSSIVFGFAFITGNDTTRYKYKDSAIMCLSVNIHQKQTKKKIVLMNLPQKSHLKINIFYLIIHLLYGRKFDRNSKTDVVYFTQCKIKADRFIIQAKL